VVKELLSDAGRRSCLRAMNREGATPLHLAVQSGLMDVAQLLVNAGAKVDAPDRVSGHSGDRAGRVSVRVLKGQGGCVLVWVCVGRGW
jgi:ankyrin repeat protein